MSFKPTLSLNMLIKAFGLKRSFNGANYIKEGVNFSIGKGFRRFKESISETLVSCTGLEVEEFRSLVEITFSKCEVVSGNLKVINVIASVAKQSSQNILDCHNFALRMPASSPLLWGGRSCACASKLQMRGGGSSCRVEFSLPDLRRFFAPLHSAQNDRKSLLNLSTPQLLNLSYKHRLEGLACSP